MRDRVWISREHFVAGFCTAIGLSNGGSALASLVGSSEFAATLFAIGVLAAGQASTMTGGRSLSCLVIISGCPPHRLARRSIRHGRFLGTAHPALASIACDEINSAGTM